MIEVVPASLQPLGQGETTAPSQARDLGNYTLTGEIVDSKCYLGVMKPGNLKPHRSCAIRCISGGIPPVFLVRDQDGNALYFLLAGEDGRMINRDVLGMVADPIEITGRVEMQDDLLLLKAEPATFQPINQVKAHLP